MSYVTALLIVTYAELRFFHTQIIHVIVLVAIMRCKSHLDLH